MNPRIAAIVAAAFVVLVFGGRFVRTIPPGHVGVVTDERGLGSRETIPGTGATAGRAVELDDQPVIEGRTHDCGTCCHHVTGRVGRNREESAVAR